MKTFLATITVAVLSAALAVGLSAAGCGSNSGTSADLEGNSNADGGCVTNPTTHVEIINRCTSAESYDKIPFYPMLAPNGELPMLP